MVDKRGKEDRDKIIMELEKAYRDEKKIGLVLKQIIDRTRLPREKAKFALKDLIHEGKVGESDLTSNESKRDWKIYYLKRYSYQTGLDNLPSKKS